MIDPVLLLLLLLLNQTVGLSLGFRQWLSLDWAIRLFFLMRVFGIMMASGCFKRRFLSLRQPAARDSSVPKCNQL